MTERDHSNIKAFVENSLYNKINTLLNWGDWITTSCIMYMRKLFGSTTLTDSTVVSMYSWDHTDTKDKAILK